MNDLLQYYSHISSKSDVSIFTLMADIQVGIGFLSESMDYFDEIRN